jgi:hypothetical protein
VSSNEPSGFSGVIRFKNWPPADSVLELRLMAFTELRSDTVTLLAALVLGHALTYPPVGRKGFAINIDTIQYAFTSEGTSLQVTTYKYIAVAQRYGPNIFTDWRPCGVYSAGLQPFDPTPVKIVANQVTPNTDIAVDFKNPPPRLWQ